MSKYKAALFGLCLIFSFLGSVIFVVLSIVKQEIVLFYISIIFFGVGAIFLFINSYYQKLNVVPSPGNAIPKRWLRPFVCFEYDRLDNKIYRYVAGSDKSELFSLFMIFPLLGGIFAVLALILTGFESSLAWYGAIIGLGTAYWMYHRSKLVKPTRFIIFDREHGTVSWPKWVWTDKIYIFPFNEIEGRLAKSANRYGAPLFQLWLHHPPTRTLKMLEEAGAGGVDSPLGHWSFLVQFMDKNLPLPSVQGLEKYQTTDGLYSYRDWAEKNIAGSNQDPYVLWKIELDERPDLDSNYEVVKRYKAMKSGRTVTES